MNKQEPQNAGGSGGGVGSADVANPDKVTLQAITEAMEHPECTAEQLPELWQQATKHPVRERIGIWNDGVEAMYRRCTTLSQHTEIAVVLAGMAHAAWHETGWIVGQADDLAHQATPAQILQALVHEQQHPEGWWKASDHIMMWATAEQLTGPVIEQLPWKNQLLDYATTAEQLVAMDPAFEQRRQHIVEHVQQQLLDGNKNAWIVFLGIVDPGTVIGTVVELANAVAQQNGPVRTRT